MAFSGLVDIAAAVAGPRSLSDRFVRESVAVIRAAGGARLGFFGARRTDAIEAGVRILQEEGRSLSEEERLKVVAALKELDEVRRLRIRVVVQISITVAVVGVALGVVFGAIPASDDLKKVSYGLLGTAAGYWLK
jgi:hypothetical protein